jgi:hypothetical protein
MTIISYNMFNIHLEWPPSSMNGCTLLLLRYKGVRDGKVQFSPVLQWILENSELDPNTY